MVLESSFILHYYNWKYIIGKNEIKRISRQKFALNPLLHLLSLTIFYLFRSHVGNVLHTYCKMFQSLNSCFTQCMFSRVMFRMRRRPRPSPAPWPPRTKPPSRSPSAAAPSPWPCRPPRKPITTGIRRYYQPIIGQRNYSFAVFLFNSYEQYFSW